MVERLTEQQFRRLYREHTPALYRTLLRLTRGRVDLAEDAVQETWVRAVTRLDTFEGRSALRTWLTGIALRCAREVLREPPREREDLDLAAHAAADDREPPDLTADEMDEVLGRLPFGYRQVLVLHDVEGHTHEEIAGMLGVSEGTSKSQLSRARTALRRLIRSTP